WREDSAKKRRENRQQDDLWVFLREEMGWRFTGQGTKVVGPGRECPMDQKEIMRYVEKDEHLRTSFQSWLHVMQSGSGPEPDALDLECVAAGDYLDDSPVSLLSDISAWEKETSQQHQHQHQQEQMTPGDRGKGKAMGKASVSPCSGWEGGGNLPVRVTSDTFPIRLDGRLCKAKEVDPDMPSLG
ncbi:unnamed protein product, partial [Discosporangium mesarthrocarpum]